MPNEIELGLFEEDEDEFNRPCDCERQHCSICDGHVAYNGCCFSCDRPD